MVFLSAIYQNHPAAYAHKCTETMKKMKTQLIFDIIKPVFVDVTFLQIIM